MAVAGIVQGITVGWYMGSASVILYSLVGAYYTEQVNTMGKPLGFEFTGKPQVLIAQSIDVRAWMVTKCGTGCPGNH